MRATRLPLLLAALAVTMPLSAVRAQARDSIKPSAVQPAGTRPSYATGRCNDGTYWTNVDRTGACVGHGGVSEFFPLNPPKDATALCSDGTYSTSLNANTACAQHGGVRYWVRQRTTPDVTGRCSDGFLWRSPNQSNACAGHGGVAEWYGSSQGSTAPKP